MSQLTKIIRKELAILCMEAAVKSHSIIKTSLGLTTLNLQPLNSF